MSPDDGAPVGAAIGAASRADGDGLRRRYARWMAAYPPVWRREHGEALLGTFLDAADARGGTGPTRREAAGILRHGLAWRLRLLAPSTETRRLAGLLALTSGTVLAVLCFLAGEWQPGMAAQGWRVQPGHVGPFATLGVLLYALWFAALVAQLAGRATAARRLLVGLVALAAVIGASGVLTGIRLLVANHAPTGAADLLGLRRPPGWALVGLVALSGLVLLGRLRPTPRERALVVVAAVVGSAWIGWLMVTAQPDAFAVDPSYVFYRRSGFSRFVEVVVYQTVPLVLLVAALARRWRPAWLPAVLLWTLAFLPYATPPVMVTRFVERWIWRFGGESLLLSSLVDSLVGWGSVLLLGLAVRWRWRRGRPGPSADREGAVAG